MNGAYLLVRDLYRGGIGRSWVHGAGCNTPPHPRKRHLRSGYSTAPPGPTWGLSNVGYYSIRTTLLFSTASLFLPLAFRFSSTSSRGVWIYLLVTIYILTIIASFVYPTFKINRAAAALRDEILEDIRTEYTSLQQQTLSVDEGVENINRRLEMQRLRSKYDDYREVSLYPLQIDILLQLAGSIILPLLFV